MKQKNVISHLENDMIHKFKKQSHNTNNSVIMNVNKGSFEN